MGVGSGLGAVTVDLRDLLVLAGDLGLAAEAVLAGLFFLAGLRPLDLQSGHTFLGLQCINQLLSSIFREKIFSVPSNFSIIIFERL